MLIKVLKMKTGEQVVTGITELQDENSNGICFLVTQPYRLDLIPSDEISLDGTPETFRVNFTKWFSVSKDVQFRIPYDSVVAIGEPDDSVLQTYTDKFGDLLNDIDTVQPSNSSDSSERSGVSDSGDRGEGGEP
jgi:hypothetical protein